MKIDTRIRAERVLLRTDELFRGDGKINPKVFVVGDSVFLWLYPAVREAHEVEVVTGKRPKIEIVTAQEVLGCERGDLRVAWDTNMLGEHEEADPVPTPEETALVLHCERKWDVLQRKMRQAEPLHPHGKRGTKTKTETKKK